jgi:uncharacterized SAM-binding protein YcdF (DUF218 family)
MTELIAKLLEAPLERGLRDVPDTTDVVPSRDAVVVLGSPLRDDALTPVAIERVAAATALWCRGGGRWVVASGGVTRGGRRAEADALAEALVAAGVAAAAIIVERASRSTAENATLTAALLRNHGARSAWVVTQPFHAKRAAYLLNRAGIATRAWWIADSLQYRDRPRAIRWLVREYAAWARLALASVDPRNRRS